MRTLILPGFSPKNLEWAIQTQEDLTIFKPEVISWPHWETGKAEPRWIKQEALRISQIIGPDTANVIAKSIGTVVAMELIKFNHKQIHKLILCGIPINDLYPLGISSYQELNKLSPKQVISFQNQDDPHGSFGQIETLLRNINSDILVRSFSRSDHEYPYSSQFIEFLK